jgi:integrase
VIDAVQREFTLLNFSMHRLSDREDKSMQNQSKRIAANHALLRRVTAAGVETKIGNHSFRTTGLTANLKNGGAHDAIFTPATPRSFSQQ